MTELSIFKKYDVRGKYPQEINADVASKIAKAYLSVLKPDEVVIGHDNIAGSDVVAVAISKVLSTSGVKVRSIGMVTTPMLYYYGSSNALRYSIMCTASHLGEGYTGMKPNVDGVPVEEEILKKIKEAYESLDASVPDNNSELQVPVLRNLVYKDYSDAVVKLVGGQLKKYKIAVDYGNGGNSMVSKEIFLPLGMNVVSINTEIRGTDLNHPSNPKIKQNRKQLEESLLSSSCDLGLIWDGDCDRCYFLDWKGEVIPPEYIAVKIAQLFKKIYGYEKITADVRASFAVERELVKSEVAVKRIKAWHVPIKYEMIEDSGIGFGFEVSGHYVFRDFYKIDDGMLAGLFFIKALEVLDLDFRKDLTDFTNNYYILEEINFESPIDETSLVNLLKEKYSTGKVNLVDGISVDYPNWRFNVRASRSEPIIRLNISGTDKKEVDLRLSEIEKIIGGKRLA